jgi:ornithine cyclodeaminase/alanine dehydrogenase-like protein (mu-crystallin family)
VFGANLVITASGEVMRDGLDQVRPSHLVHGTVLVNTSGHDLPRAIVDRFDQVYVDDLALLAANSHRYVVARHLKAETALDRPNTGQRSPRIAGDLGQLLTGAHPGREQADDVVLVELLRTNTLSVQLADKISEASRLRGLGVQVTA